MFYLGLIFLLSSVFIGYLVIGGNIAVLFQPSEWIMIVGAAIGSYIISNPPDVGKGMIKSLKKLNKKSPYMKSDYLELLSFMFNFFKFAHSNGLVELENHIDDTEKSKLFNSYPIMHNEVDAKEFFCDYFRMIVLGFEDHIELENMMDEDIESRKHYFHSISQSLIRTGDSLPALGIVAAVLGVITAMASVGSDPSILGPKIASALVGTFIGAFTAYGIVNPIGFFISKYKEDEIKFLECIRCGIIAHLSGYPPSLSIEFARQSIPKAHKPIFEEVESRIQNKI